MGFVNFAVAKGKLGDLILETYKAVGRERTVEMLDDLKELGFRTAMMAGLSIGIDDMIIPQQKTGIVKNARKRIDEVQAQYAKGIITEGERYNKTIDIWTNTTDEIAKCVYEDLQRNGGRKGVNPVFLMMDSGARGNKQQVRQLCGTRGLMAKPSGDIIERPILSSFREGLSVLEYFISTHGARKGLADTALKTADAGYLTRKLCDVAMDCVIEEYDDGRRDGVIKTAIYEGDDEIVSLFDRIVGRCPPPISATLSIRMKSSSKTARLSPRSRHARLRKLVSRRSRSCPLSPAARRQASPHWSMVSTWPRRRWSSAAPLSVSSLPSRLVSPARS